MKKLLVVCVILAALGGLVYAAGLQPILSTDSPSKNATSNASQELQSLVEQIQAAKAMNQVPDEALYARLEQLMTQSGASSLDCQPHNYVTGVAKQGAGVCDSATVISSLPYSDTGVLDLTDNCPGRPFNDVFYVFTAPHTADYIIDMCGSYSDSYLRVWLDGACCTGNSVTEDDSCGNSSLDPRMHIALTAGQTVYLECGLYNASARNRAYALHIEEITPPVNCYDLPLCGEPAEVELNNFCPPPENQTVLTCGGEVYGKVCMAVAADHDFWKVIVPPYSMLYVAQYDGEGCTATPTTCVQSKVYFDDCTLAASNASTSGWTATNSGAEPFVFYIDVFGIGSCMGTYKLTATCCQTVDYCANPIVIPGVTHFESTVNTCCATNPILSVYADNCAGTAYGSGNDVIYLMNLSQATTMDITVSGGDAQVMVFTDCSNANSTCVASSDALSGPTETISNLTLPAGVYYVSMSMYSTPTNNACGNMTIVINADHQLPVELTSFTATGGDGSITLNWKTASEQNNDRFELVRDGRTVASVSSQGSGATGHRYVWTETNLHNGNSYHYTLYSVDLNGHREAIGTAEATPSQTAQVSEYALYQNYPNPFNPTTQISFDLVESGQVSLTVYNLMGQSVADLVHSSMASGHHAVTLNAANLPSGVYLYRLSVNGFTSEKKMLLLK